MSDFLDDGRAALEWVERYLERVGELPVLAQVEPGEIRARLPASPPEEAEPFSAVLRDLDEVLLPGVTHWQHPRYFAYFATNASRPGILAELLAAALNNVAILWRTAPASTELEGLVCDWVAQLLGLPEGWHGHIEDSASTSTLAALIAARHTTGRDRRRLLRARALVGREGRADARDASCARSRSTASTGCAPTGSTSSDAAVGGARPSARPRPTSVDPVAAVADLCEQTGTWLHVDAAYAGTAMVCQELRWAFDGRRARRLAGRQRAQVDAHADGLLAAVDEPARGLPRRVQPRPRVPAHARRGGRAAASASTGPRSAGASAR